MLTNIDLGLRECNKINTHNQLTALLCFGTCLAVIAK